jgi:integrase
MTKQKKTLKSLSENQVKQLIQAELSKKGKSEYYNFIRVRNAFIFQFQFYLGLRPKEAYDGKLEYFDFENKSYYIPAKNNKQRFEDFAFIPDFLIPRLKAYLEIRKKFFPESQWLFPTNRRGEELIGVIQKIGNFQTLQLQKRLKITPKFLEMT